MTIFFFYFWKKKKKKELRNPVRPVVAFKKEDKILQISKNRDNEFFTFALISKEIVNKNILWFWSFWNILRKQNPKQILSRKSLALMLMCMNLPLFRSFAKYFFHKNYINSLIFNLIFFFSIWFYTPFINLPSFFYRICLVGICSLSPKDTKRSFSSILY